MISTSEFKSGQVIRWKGNLYEILTYQHVKMQQRSPIVRTKLMKLKGGNVTEQTFRSGDKFEDIYVERKQIQYLYRDGNIFHFMDSADYHDVTVSEELIGDRVAYLREQDMATGLYCDGTLVSIELPASVSLKVAETEPGLRGDTAKGGSKPAKLETGVIIKVPLFINNGDQVRIDTRTGDYIARD